MTNLQLIRQRHADCGCLTSHHPSQSGEDVRRITHQQCALRIRGFRLAIDCNRCKAFDDTTTKRPDLIVLREFGGRSEWLVTEIKSQMDSEARDQVVAGLKVLANHPRFSGLRADVMIGLLAFTRANRTADLTRLRRPLRIDGEQISIKDHRCGDTSI